MHDLVELEQRLICFRIPLGRSFLDSLEVGCRKWDLSLAPAFCDRYRLHQDFMQIDRLLPGTAGPPLGIR